MPRFTSAYSAYTERLDEVLILVRKAAALERSKDAFTRGKEIDALCRGAIVLLSSHVEAFVKELGECLLDALYAKAVCRSRLDDQFFYHASRRSLDGIRKEADPGRVSIGVFEFVDQDATLWSRTGALPRAIDTEEFNRGFANPKVEKVQKYLSRFGYQSLKHDFNVALRGDSVAILATIDRIVETRNSIAHGEASATRTPAEVREMVDASRSFCRTLDTSFAGWSRNALCSIR